MKLAGTLAAAVPVCKGPWRIYAVVSVDVQCPAVGDSPERLLHMAVGGDRAHPAVARYEVEVERRIRDVSV